MDALRLLMLACAAMTAYSQICPPLTLVFLWDTSENAREGATEEGSATPFNILQDQMRKFLVNPYMANPSNNISIAMYGYSSNGAFEIAPAWKTPAETLQLLPKISTATGGGSWSYVGLEYITIPPLTDHNIVKMYSSQGSTTASRANLSRAAAERLRKDNWFISVTAVKAANPINMTELTAINNGVPPKIVTDSTNVRGYRNLAADLDSILSLLGCTPMTAEEICSSCLYEAGSYYARHPEYCDAFIYCRDNPPSTLACPAGTFYHKGNCNHINDVTCLVGECTSSTPNNTYYHSYRCCNQYFECTGGKIVQRQCPANQKFNNAIKACENITNPEMACGEVGRHICDVKAAEPVASQPRTCTFDCRKDPTNNPCEFICYGERYRLPAGTMWSEQECSLLASDACQPSNDTTTRDLSPDCAAPFLVTFNGGGTEVYNQRIGDFIYVYSTTQEVTFANGSAVYPADTRDPRIYFYYLANVDYGVNFAFRLRFKLANPTIGTIYDLLSNNYCAECPETISFTAIATSATDRVVTVQFKTTSGIAFIKANISLSSPDMWLEIVVVFADTFINGVLKEVAQDGVTVIKRSQFSTFTKPTGSIIETNRCGIQLGRGSNKHLVGSIDEFAIHRFCQNITMVMN